MEAVSARLPSLLAALAGFVALGWTIGIPLLRHLMRRASDRMRREGLRRENAGTEQGEYDP